ncbi:hypothetical protein [Granulicoccus phenolivorans]|uniref:hypothetical protein n=1 Tax=Granulicoccus phenolivorans TaxID=266854 RepID=UPI000417ACBF|nr:hypothetical protein [Granulicoccus phenolivorans]
MATTFEANLERWAKSAYLILRDDVATRYHATITYSDLAERVQKHSGIVAKGPSRQWIGKVLGLVVRVCHHNSDPALSALVVHKTDGMVGAGYDLVLKVAALPALTDPQEREEHAARARLECYRKFCHSMPADGGTPGYSTIYTEKAARAAQRAARPPKPEENARPLKFCPTCFVALPATGICDECES